MNTTTGPVKREKQKEKTWNNFMENDRKKCLNMSSSETGSSHVSPQSGNTDVGVTVTTNKNQLFVSTGHKRVTFAKENDIRLMPPCTKPPPDGTPNSSTILSELELSNFGKNALEKLQKGNDIVENPNNLCDPLPSYAEHISLSTQSDHNIVSHDVQSTSGLPYISSYRAYPCTTNRPGGVGHVDVVNLGTC